MGDKSGIEWCDATWNPTTGCDRVSPGCANCYALTLAPRLQKMAVKRSPTDPYMRDGDPKTSGVGFGLMMHENRLVVPLNWTKPRRIFVNSMSDLFHPEVTDDFIDRVFAVMALAQRHTFQILTKRPDRMRDYMAIGLGDEDRERRSSRTQRRVWKAVEATQPGAEWPGWPLPNVWMGTSVENAHWRTRITELRQVPAAVRFLSCEPLLGPLDECDACHGKGGGYDPTDMPGHPLWVSCAWCQGTGHREGGAFNLTGIDWVIIGGESGSGARPMEEDWVRRIVAECRRQEAAPFVKQMGDAWSREHLGHPGHGGNIEDFPEDLQVREYPRQAVPA